MNSALLRKSLFVLCLIGGMAVTIISCSKKDDAVVKSRELTFTFGTFPIKEYTCDQSFTKDNVTLTLESSYGHEEDCAHDAENCNFSSQDDKLAIGVGRAVFDVSKLGKLKKATVRLTDYCGVDCAKVILLDKNGETIAIQGNTIYIDPESITFESNLENVHSIAVSGCECHIESLTINYES